MLNVHDVVGCSSRPQPMKIAHQPTSIALCTYIVHVTCIIPVYPEQHDKHPSTKQPKSMPNNIITHNFQAVSLNRMQTCYLQMS